MRAFASSSAKSSRRQNPHRGPQNLDSFAMHWMSTGLERHYSKLALGWQNQWEEGASSEPTPDDGNTHLLQEENPWHSSQNYTTPLQCRGGRIIVPSQILDHFLLVVEDSRRRVEVHRLSHSEVISSSSRQQWQLFFGLPSSRSDRERIGGRRTNS